MIARLAVLAVPVGVGMAWMALAGTDQRMIAVQAIALVIGASIIAVGSRFDIPSKPLGIVVVVLLYAPILLGPEIGGERRWISFGPIALTSALLCLPALSILLGRARRSWFVGPLALIFIAALLQSDPSIIIALACVVIVLGKTNLVAILAGFLFLTIGCVLAVRDTMEPVRFVEGVLVETTATNLAMAVFLVASLLVSAVTLLRCCEAPAMQKSALVACTFGLLFASVIGPYPTPLIGYGAASVLGLSLALAILKPEIEGSRSA